MDFNAGLSFGLEDLLDPVNPQAMRSSALRGQPIGTPRLTSSSAPARLSTPPVNRNLQADTQEYNPRTTERESIQKQMDQLNAPADYTSQIGEAKRRSQDSGRQLLLAMAAQQAGEQYKPMAGTYLKKAMEMRDPLKVEGGFINEQGDVVIDPAFQREKQLTRLQARLKAIDDLDMRDATLQQQRELARERMQLQAQIAGAVNALGRDNLELRREMQQDRRDAAAAKANDPKFSEGERVSQGYLARMRAAEDLLDKNPSSQTMGWNEWLVGGIPKVGGVAANAFTRDPQRQTAYQAQEDWVRAKLRKESGAVIGEQEMAREIATYFPMPGDSDALVAQKREARRMAERQLEISGAVNEKRDLTGIDRPQGPSAGAGPRAGAVPRTGGVEQRVKSYYGN
jgi:hypothetical protein